MQNVTRTGIRWRLATVFFTVALQAGAQVTTRNDTVGRLLNLWFDEGSAAGLDRITYENRDGAHSPLNTAEWPQLHVYQPTEEEKKLGAAPGAAMMVRPLALIGNASMAAPADKGGSIPRLYEASASGMNFLTNQYLSNNLFFYPSHQDHLPGWNGVGGWGDLYPTNTPWVIISQGSSGTDQPFLRAFLSATAALPRDTQRRLISARLLMPVLQSLFRQSNKPVRTQEDYFTGAAHPPVFRAENIDEERFVLAAHSLTQFAIPPLVALAVKSESPEPQNGRDYFELPVINNEKLSDSPCVIARIFRGSAFRRELTVSARRSNDIGGHPIQFHWALLQGDAHRVKIEPTSDGSEAQITLAWHPEIRSAAGLASHRVDIGVFATNGITWSAPAFITFFMLPNELRQYRDDGQLEEINYEAGNPHPGLPSSNDLRWLNLGHKMSPSEPSLAGKLLRDVLPEAAAKMLLDTAEVLAAKQENLRKLNADIQTKPQAAAALSELETALRQRVEASLPDGKTLREVVQNAFVKLAEKPDLFTANQSTILTAAKNSGNITDFFAARQRALDFRVLAEDDGGHYVLLRKPKQLSAGDIAVLRDFHLSVLALALFPEFLERSNKPAWVDPRLTTLKAWRDLHHYDNEGREIGWTRITNGREYEFDAEGRLLPDGPGGRAVPVKYARDEATGHLLFAPK
ncbi:MAG: hypothetical protein K8R87_13580 [Verrucomicrobia bacterium]|nr:hypothetical protein [Verrucomicrobiota bacterium]